MKKIKNIGSNFDDFLKEEGLLENVKVSALKSVLAYLLQKEMTKKQSQVMIPTLLSLI